MENEEHEPERLLGWHVTEAGRRQAWPFLQLADPSSGREVRVYLDADYAVHPLFKALNQGHERATVALESLLGATVTEARAERQGLERRFGTESLVVADHGNELTVHQPWWVGSVSS